MMETRQLRSYFAVIHTPDAPRPDVILLDWNLPSVDGSELLELIRASEDLRSIPVVILTGSHDQLDALKAYHLRANCYVTKPIDLSGVSAILDSCRELSLTISTEAGNSPLTAAADS